MSAAVREAAGFLRRPDRASWGGSGLVAGTAVQGTGYGARSLP